MPSLDSARRGISLVLAVLCLLIVPGLASAKFTDRESTGDLQVGAATLTAPTALRGTYTCDGGFLTVDTLRVQVTGVVAANPGSVDYQLQLVIDNAVRAEAVAPDATSPVTLTGTTTSFLSERAWTLQARAQMHSWTGPWYSKKIHCPAVGIKTGDL